MSRNEPTIKNVLTRELERVATRHVEPESIAIRIQILEW
jgi:hypothetical protein